jgi:hypothetical protein
MEIVSASFEIIFETSNFFKKMVLTFFFYGFNSILHIHETKIKMAEMVKMVKMVKIISTWTFPKVEMAKITSYYIILIRYK